MGNGAGALHPAAVGKDAFAVSRIRTNANDQNETRRALRQIEQTLESPYKVVVMTDDAYDAQFGDLVDVTTAVTTPRVNLPDIGRNRGRTVSVKRSTTQRVLVRAGDGQTVDGEQTYELDRPKQSAAFVCVDGARWVVLG